MNIANILKLADRIERQEHVSEFDNHGFNMSKCWHPCGTPSCIAGFAFSMSGKRAGCTFTEARRWLGIDKDRQWDLFMPSSEWREDMGVKWLNEITPSQAAWTLRNLAETGEIVWKQS